MAKESILAVLAHPDDESFGIGGTLAKLSQEYDVYLICATDGNDPGKDDDLIEIRRGELEAAADTLGLKKVYYFDYPDGTLRNDIYHEVAEKIQAIVDETKPFRLITFEHRGGSGHLDHVAVSMISSYVFERNEDIEEIWYYLISKGMTDKIDDYFIYFPPGYTAEEADLVMNVEDVWDTKIEAMKKHQSQLKDINNILERQADLPKEELFLVRER